MAQSAAAALLGAWSWGGAAFTGLPAPSPALLVRRPAAAASSAQAGALRRGAAADAGASAAASAPGLPAAGLLCFAAAAWRRAAPGRSSGRTIVRGRNYETNIRKKKGPADAAKVKLAAKHLRKIIVAVRENGPDENMNSGLKRTIKAALKDNVPRSTIDARIKKFVEDKESITEVDFGGYGAGGAAIMVQGVTDNQNRFRVEVREAFKEVGGQIGTEGCVDHLFNKQGVIRFEGLDEEQVMEASMEAEAEVEDCIAQENGVVDVITLPEHLHSAAKALESQGLEPVSSDMVFEPTITKQLNEEGSYEVQRLLHLLQEIDDVQEVRHNAELLDVELKYNPYGAPVSYEKAQKQK